MQKGNGANGRRRKDESRTDAFGAAVGHFDDPPFAVVRREYGAHRRFCQVVVQQVNGSGVQQQAERTGVDYSVALKPEQKGADDGGGNDAADDEHGNAGAHFLRIVGMFDRRAVAEAASDVTAEEKGGDKGAGHDADHRQDIVVDGCLLFRRQTAVPAERRFDQFKDEAGEGGQRLPEFFGMKN